MKKEAKYWAWTALVVQDACNLTAVIHAFSRMMTDLSESNGLMVRDTDWINTHPLAVMFTDKCAQLSGVQNIGTDQFSKAYKWCCDTRDGKRPNDFDYA